RNAACKSAISPLSDRPSIVSTERSCVCTASIKQERTISPLTRTVHAPQTPCSQPTWVPVSLRWSRRKSDRFSRGGTSASMRSPLTLSEIVTALVTLALRRGDRDEKAERTRHAPARPSPDVDAWRALPADLPGDQALHPTEMTPRTKSQGLWRHRSVYWLTWQATADHRWQRSQGGCRRT